jgi:uncharacterized membrane protein
VEILTQQGGEFLSRWGHYLSGVTWIGLLYYFNFVQVPSFAAFEAAPRTEAIRKLVPRALWWFRWGAVLTLLTGLSILAFQETLFEMDYYKTPPGMSIATGITLALFMFANVWLIIWPNQRIVIANAERTAAGQEADPAAAPAGRKALAASRTNTLFSIPMLFFMGATSHFAPVYEGAEGGKRALYWIVVLVLIVAIEAIALRTPAAGSGAAWHIDNHRNTIIAGFVLAAIFYILFEVVNG